jgi:hypothetical protein
MAAVPADRPLRIGNCSGFYGDRRSAMREMLDGEPLDVLTGDYLAELTMLILDRGRGSRPGYAAGFLRQLEDCLATAVERGARIVVNAGGLDPTGCAAQVRELAGRLGLSLRVAHVEGDDVLDRLPELRAAGVRLDHLDTGEPLPAEPSVANCYLGGWGIAAALTAGADVVITGRVTDAALVIGSAAWWHGWSTTDWDPLAGALVAGHVLECGAQATGGNYSFFHLSTTAPLPGFPLAEIARDGSAVITKQPGSGGMVTVGTVTAQLLYELGAPRYLNPDVTADFSTARLREVGPDRVEISETVGAPPPPTTKLGLGFLAGYRNRMTFVVPGTDVDAKVELLQAQLAPALRDVAEVRWTLHRTSSANPATNEDAAALLDLTVADPDRRVVGRRLSNAAVEVALSTYPGCSLTTPPTDATSFGVFWPTLIPNEHVRQTVVVDGEPPVEVPTVPSVADAPALPSRVVAAGSAPPWDDYVAAPLGLLVGARSGDKAGNANLGVWVDSPEAFAWLACWLDAARLRTLLPEVAELRVDRYELPNLHAVNFVIHRLLGAGVAASTRFDPQAKGLGEWLRSRVALIPTALLHDGTQKEHGEDEVA